MSQRLAQVYERLKMVTENRKDENGDSHLLYSDVTQALRNSQIPDSEVIGSIKDCLVAHAFVGASVLSKVGGPQRMEIPVGETESLAKALYYVMQVQKLMLDQEALSEMLEEEVSDVGTEDPEG
jgi:hypothetical protein